MLEHIWMIQHGEIIDPRMMHIFSQWSEHPVSKPHAADACVQLDLQPFRGISGDLSSETGGLWWVQVRIHTGGFL